MPTYTIRVLTSYIGALVGAMAPHGEVLSFNLETEEEVQQRITRHRTRDTSTTSVIVRLLHESPNNTVTRAAIAREYKRIGYKQASIGPAISNLNKTKKFEITKKLVRLTDLAVTEDNIDELIAALK